MIRKRGSKWVVISHKTKKVLGTYASRAAAVAALRRMKYYKNKRKS